MKHQLTWNDYLKTGIDIVDQQHRGLLDLTNETAAKLSADQDLSNEEIRVLLGYLAEYAATHFATEEALMALGGIGEAHIIHHRESHARFLRQVEAMVEESGGHTLAGQQVVDFLGNWLIYHILGEDQQLSQLLQDPAPGHRPANPLRAAAAAENSAAAQSAVNQSLSKLYTFMAERNQHLQAREQSYRDQSNRLAELVSQQDQALVVSEERFRALFHNGALPIVILSLDQDMKPARLIEANPAACQLLGYDENAFEPLVKSNILAPEELARFPLLLRELQVAGKFECEMTLLTRTGSRLAAQIAMTELVAHGDPVIMLLIQEVSMRRAAEPERAGVQQQADRLAEIRSRYLSGLPEIEPHNTSVQAPASAEIPDDPHPAWIADFLAEQTLFKDLAVADRQLLTAESGVRRLQKGESIFRKGDSPAHLVLVTRGSVLLAVSSPQGEKTVLGIYNVGQSVGEAELVMDSVYPYYAEALDEAEVLQIGRPALMSVLDKDHLFARRLMNCLGARQHDLLYRVESYTLRSGTERVIGYLLQHAIVQSSGRLVAKLPAAKQVIASMLHVKPETLSRIFRDLSEAGLIEGKGRQVQIPDLDKLVAYHA